MGCRVGIEEVADGGADFVAAVAAAAGVLDVPDEEQLAKAFLGELVDGIGGEAVALQQGLHGSDVEDEDTVRGAGLQLEFGKLLYGWPKVQWHDKLLQQRGSEDCSVVLEVTYVTILTLSR